MANYEQVIWLSFAELPWSARKKIMYQKRAISFSRPLYIQPKNRPPGNSDFYKWGCPPYTLLSGWRDIIDWWGGGGGGEGEVGSFIIVWWWMRMTSVGQACLDNSREYYPIPGCRGVTNRCQYLSWPIAPSYMSPKGGGGGCGVSAIEFSCAQCTWSPNKLHI